MSNSQVVSIGIDLGSLRSVIAVAKRGGVEVITNEASNRETANTIGFGPAERFIGEQGALQSKSNFKNTVSFFTRFLGISGRPPFLREETKWLSCQNQLTEDGKFAFNVQYKGAPAQYLPEQLTASMLNKLKEIIASHQINLASSNVVISVPSYYTEQERKALMDACKIAELPIDRLLNETTAIATSYGLFRKQELDNATPRYVAFIDMGHSKTSAFVGCFTKEKANIVAQVNDRNLGARDLDWSIFEHCCEVFERESGGLNPKENKKAQLRLLDAIEKQRKVLSANSDSSINVEYLMEDVDFNLSISREQFVTMVQPALQRFASLIEFLAVQITNLKLKLHSIEVVGGGTRIPAIQGVIQKILGIETVSRTLNASESVARGCVMIAAQKNPNFRVTEYNIEDSNFYPIRIGWLYGQTLDAALRQEKMEVENSSITHVFPEKQRPVLFDNQCPVPSLKSFNLTKHEAVELTLFYDPVPAGFQAVIQQIQVPALKPKHPEYHSKIRIRLDQNGLTHLEDVNLVEEYMEDVKVAKEKHPKVDPKVDAKADAKVDAKADAKADAKVDAKAEPKLDYSKDAKAEQPNGMQEEAQSQSQEQSQSKEQEFEIKKKKKQLSSAINCEFTNLYFYSKQQIQQFFEIESDMINHDKITHETYQRKNQLESYIYNMKGNLDGKHKEFVTPQDLQVIIKALDSAYEWLYNDGSNATRSQYQQRLDTIKALGDPVNKRFKELLECPELLNQFMVIIGQIENIANSQDEMYSHITPEERLRVLEDSKTARVWVNKNLTELSKVDKTKDIPITTAQINQFRNEFVQKSQSTMSRPKPAVKKPEVPIVEEVKPEEATEQQSTKMDTE